MNYAFTEEQLEFRTVLRRFFEELSPATEVRRLMATEEGFDETGWRRISQELGLTGIAIPEEHGGQGFGFVELAMVFEEMGRRLVCAPFFSSIGLAANAILNAGTEAQKNAMLPRIASGDARAALALAEPSGRWDTGGITVTATEEDDGYRLDGVKSFVVDGATADLLIVAARRTGSQGDGGLSLFTVDTNAEGLTRTPLKVMDPTRKQAMIGFNNVKGQLLGREGAAAEPLRRTLLQAATCLASEMAGGAEMLRESALDYAMMRVQFGRQIASFQTMKHKQADMLHDVELAKAAAYQAAQAAAADSPDFPAVAHLAKASVADAYMQTAIHTIQIYGGIGFTWDNDTHLWFKRAKSSEVMLGSSGYHRELMLQNWAA
ncbi:MAG: acyl-CoA dehydrogenase family protein [Minwuia sp.]|uniref:acyl-CoA dehydrogenase family protein n=1 Tax=Minwuia sp. TaxID=2493630 RepID=UPI003A8967B1